VHFSKTWNKPMEKIINNKQQCQDAYDKISLYLSYKKVLYENHTTKKSFLNKIEGITECEIDVSGYALKCPKLQVFTDKTTDEEMEKGFYVSPSLQFHSESEFMSSAIIKKVIQTSQPYEQDFRTFFYDMKVNGSLPSFGNVEHNVASLQDITYFMDTDFLRATFLGNFLFRKDYVCAYNKMTFLEITALSCAVFEPSMISYLPLDDLYFVQNVCCGMPGLFCRVLEKTFLSQYIESAVIKLMNVRKSMQPECYVLVRDTVLSYPFLFVNEEYVTEIKKDEYLEKIDVSRSEILVYQEFGNGNIEKDDQVNYDLSIVDSRQEELSAGDVVMDIWYDIFLYLEKIEMMVLRGVNSSFYIMLSDMLKKKKYQETCYYRLSQLGGYFPTPRRNLNVSTFIQRAFIGGVGRCPIWILNLQMNSNKPFSPIHLMFSLVDYVDNKVGSELYFYYLDLLCMYLYPYWKYALYMVMLGTQDFGTFFSFSGGQSEYVAQAISLSFLPIDIKKIVLDRYGMNDVIKFRFGYQNGVYIRNSNIVKKKRSVYSDSK